MLASIENATGPILRRLERGDKLTAGERSWLALFVVLQHRRTPVAREWLKFYDEMTAKLTAEVSLANRQGFHRRARAVDPNMSFEEVEEVRLELLADMESAQLTVESTPDMGITLYDPTPPMAASGLGFASSPNAQTVLPVDPSFAVALSPGPPVWRDVEVDDGDVEEINLHAFDVTEPTHIAGVVEEVTEPPNRDLVLSGIARGAHMHHRC